MEWEKDFPWPINDSKAQLFFCQYCLEVPKKIKSDISYVVGNRIFKRDNVEEIHHTSHRHILARDAFMSKQQLERAGMFFTL